MGIFFMTKRETNGLSGGLSDYLEDWVRAGLTELGRPKPAAVETADSAMTDTAAETATEAEAGNAVDAAVNEESAAKADVLPETVTEAEAEALPETADSAVAAASAAEVAEDGGRFEIAEGAETMSKTAVMLDQVVQKIKPTLSASKKGQILDELAAVVATCHVCPELVANRTQTVFGVGNPSAELVFVGEGPGADEDRQGIPFVGRSGQLLTDIITKGMKMRREDVFICNIVRCRPPGNRNPTGIEAQCCRPFLEATLSTIKPKFICCLGAIAATNLLETTEAIGRLRGTVHDYHGAQVVCTYHPAYLLRNPPAKKQTWEDIKLLLKAMGREIE